MGLVRSGLIIMMLALLSGCSSISQQQCERGDWFDIGFGHGQQGRTLANGKNIIYDCLEYGVRPTLEDYKRGHQEGLKDYCEPENAFTQGLNGRDYNPICRSEEFRLAWQQGHDRYVVNRHRNEISSRLNQIDDELKHIHWQLHSEELTREQRRELKHRRHRLEHEQDDLRRERALLPILDNKLELHIH
ncbi:MULTISPECIES: DUF2799 domain-containing protein [unclassified Pseudoalteromonas]|uniref:DUF2799 domain-containing protein n=1 Tax=unclassified Pseudoalteromonas TaxID=194690 RepID=UPI000CF66CBB|nr:MULTISPECIES: DUF2799 domain-containing protein [unclassified Pseudoalteromonas]MBS3797849.1 DUF2799 domain-containing protein [Pseudoalteromonas sp. BDTF-M6]